MNVIQSLKETTTKATHRGERYIETSKQYIELKIFQQLTLALSLVLKIAIIGGLLFLALIFMLVGATLALGDYLGDMALSTLIISIFLSLLALTGYVLRKKLDKRIIQKVSVEFFEK